MEEIIKKIIKKKLETAQIAAIGFLKHSARNRPNSRLRFLSASFCYCTKVVGKVIVEILTEILFGNAPLANHGTNVLAANNRSAH